jgi:ribosomal protein S18 acetylase RimI-like enzyme
MSAEIPYHIRGYEISDEDAMAELSLRAWAPVFASMESILGPELSGLLHGDWRTYQERAVRQTLTDPEMTVWVAESSGVVGFVAARIADEERGIGEIYMLAVDPPSQVHGIGTALTERATTWMREKDLRVAMISTGGDPGHAPARRVYEKARYTLLPAAGYYKAL